MRIHHLNTGTMCPIGRRFVNGTGGIFQRARMVCHCLLVETNDGLHWSIPASGWTTSPSRSGSGADGCGRRRPGWIPPRRPYSKSRRWDFHPLMCGTFC
jgi:hypothetical protein